jgi:hypothetical protein
MMVRIDLIEVFGKAARQQVRAQVAADLRRRGIPKPDPRLAIQYCDAFFQLAQRGFQSFFLDFSAFRRRLLPRSLLSLSAETEVTSRDQHQGPRARKWQSQERTAS